MFVLSFGTVASAIVIMALNSRFKQINISSMIFTCNSADLITVYIFLTVQDEQSMRRENGEKGPTLALCLGRIKNT